MPVLPEFGRIEDTKVEKPWGYELRWAITDRYLGKVLHLTKGESLSLQYHERKDECQYVIKGAVDRVFFPDKSGQIPDGDAPPPHRDRGQRHLRSLHA